MNRMMKQFGTLGVALAIAAASVLAPSAVADDKVVMNDGRIFEGEIQREIEGYVWIKIGVGGIERIELLALSDIKLIQRDAPLVQVEPENTKPASALSGADDRSPAAEPIEKPAGRALRAAVITLGDGDKDMVGLYMTAHNLRELIPVLKKDGVELVVFHVNSGGGYTLEVQRLSDAIHNDYKKHFRVAAWIESAISAAAMTSHCIEEIYFMPEGNYGACTEFSGALVASKERPLEVRLFQMENISARGGYNPAIMKAMQHLFPLSCTIDENGDAHWHQNLEGEHIVNPESRILTFDSETAMKYGFSGGTAKTLDELEDVMQLGEVIWVGRDVKGSLYPISRAEELNVRFREKTFDDQERTNEFFVIYQAAIQLASGEQDKNRRGMFVGRARSQLNSIVSMVKNNPNLGLFVLGMSEDMFEQWVEEQRQLLKDLMR